ncbi:MAG: hypothetical protein NTW58_05280, partial [Actinobacteria bacterium]|nr:hypothetical protein [Actinomycetota bacterium]
LGGGARGGIGKLLEELLHERGLACLPGAVQNQREVPGLSRLSRICAATVRGNIIRSSWDSNYDSLDMHAFQ